MGNHGRGAAHRGLRSEEERLYLVSDLLQRQHPLCARRLRAGGVLAGRQLCGDSDPGCVSCALRLCPHDEGERESAPSARRGYLPTGGQEPRGALHEQHRGGWLRLVLRAGGQRARLCARRLRAGVQCGWQRSGDGGPRRGEYARNGDGDACNDGLRLRAAGGRQGQPAHQARGQDAGAAGNGACAGIDRHAGTFRQLYLVSRDGSLRQKRLCAWRLRDGVRRKRQRGGCGCHAQSERHDLARLLLWLCHGDEEEHQPAQDCGRRLHRHIGKGFGVAHDGHGDHDQGLHVVPHQCRRQNRLCARRLCLQALCHAGGQLSGGQRRTEGGQQQQQ